MPASLPWPASFRNWVSSRLRAAGQDADAGEYLDWVALGVAAALAGGAAFAYAFGSGNAALGYGLLSALVVAGLGAYYPVSLARRRVSLLERDFPLAAKAIAAHVSAGLSFEAALDAAGSGYGVASHELAALMRQVRAGRAFPDALNEFAARSGSLPIQRVCSQLVLAYRHGRGGPELDQLSRELSGQALAAARAYNSKAAFSSVLLIAGSCVLPCVAAAYLIVSSVLFEPVLPPNAVVVLFLIIFPLLDVVLLWRIASDAPPSLVSA